MGKEEIVQELFELAETRETINLKIEIAIGELMGEISAMGEKTFWKEIAKLNKCIEGFESYTDRDKYENGIDEYIRLYSCDNTLMKAVSFYKTYEAMVDALDKPLFDVIDDQGDDGFGDVKDSFPLFGEERYNMVLKGAIYGETADQYQGENHIQMHFREKLACFAQHFIDEFKEDDE